MEILSLQEPVPESAAQVTRTDAVVISVGLHVLALVLFLFLPRYLPPSILELLSPKPPRVASLQPEARPLTQPALKSAAAPLRRPRIPLKFAYVKIPNDVAAPKNPLSPLLSDKNRRARQEMPTPASAKLFSIDPHSEGKSLDRVKPDPSRPEGPESPDLPKPKPSGGAEGIAGGTARSGAAATLGKPGSGQGSRVTDARGILPGQAAGGAGAAEPLRPGKGPRDGESTDPRENLKQALSDIKAGEYKFTFNNPAYLRGGSYGTMSFDTQDFPWGDYARKLYVIIRNNWFSRIPLAAREGIRGYVCWRFIIEKDGTVSQILSVRPSEVPPFDRAASDAIRASSPLPPLPEDFPNPHEGVTFCFFYNMSPAEGD